MRSPKTKQKTPRFFFLCSLPTLFYIKININRCSADCTHHIYPFEAVSGHHIPTDLAYRLIELMRLSPRVPKHQNNYKAEARLFLYRSAMHAGVYHRHTHPDENYLALALLIVASKSRQQEEEPPPSPMCCYSCTNGDRSARTLGNTAPTPPPLPTPSAQKVYTTLCRRIINQQ